jgi:PST family polysaccharide transporter
MSILMMFASGAVNGGVVKYTAEYGDNEFEKRKLWSTALRIGLYSTSLIVVVLIFSHNYLSYFLFKTDKYGSIFLIFASTLIFFVLNSLLLAILNGQKEIRKFITINIISSFVTLILTGSLSYSLGLYGALLSYTVGQSIIFFVTLLFVVKSNWFKMEYFMERLDKRYLKKLGRYTAMAMVSILVTSISQLSIRNYIGESIGWSGAGYWDAIWRISTTYLTLITTTLSIYYLPKLSEIKGNEELRREILYSYKIMLPVVSILALSIYFLRDFIILVLFTEDFLPMQELFFYQLIGDFFKISGWILGYIMVAKAMSRLFIITEILSSFSFVLLSILLINLYGLIGVTMGFALNHILYLLMMIFTFRNILRRTRK